MPVDCQQLEATIEADTLLEQQLQQQLTDVQLRLQANWWLWFEHCAPTAAVASAEKMQGHFKRFRGRS